MGLTKRKDGWYVAFRVLDDGKTLALARGVAGARLKRWKTGTANRTIARQQEALIKTDLMKGALKSDQVQAPQTFAQWAREYASRLERSRRSIATASGANGSRRCSFPFSGRNYSRTSPRRTWRTSAGSEALIGHRPQ